MKGKKIIVAILAVLLVITGVCFVGMKDNEVKAAVTLTMSEDGCYGTLLKADALATIDTTDELTTNDIPNYEGYLFAGWFTEADCTLETAAESVDEGAYAKFVSEDVLDIKLQIADEKVTEDAVIAENGAIRFISSVDSLDYSAVGFVVDGNQKAPITTVYEEIDSTMTDASGNKVEYQYSPKIVDTKSEYFFTAKLAASAKDRDYTVQAYWKTIDGTYVYGKSRVVCVNDDASNMINVTLDGELTAVPSDAPTIITSTKNTSTSVEATVESITILNSKDGYSNVRIVLKSGEGYPTVDGFASATKITVGSASGIFWNHTTAYTGTGTEDYSWYTVPDAMGETEFIIATNADFYGFANYSASSAFANDTIYLISDIVANNGTASETGFAAASENGTDFEFPIIGPNSNSSGFKGTFDGQNHEISGINIDDSETTNHTGLFGRMYGTVQNFKLKNSYVLGQYAVGSIAGDLQGTISGVYSNAYVKATTGPTGGIAGRSRGTAIDVKIENCWFAGQVYGVSANVGGILGYSESSKTITISNSLNSGTVKSDYSNSSATTPIACVGGIVGRVSTPIEISNCFMTGVVDNTCTSGTSTIVGRLYTAEKSCTISNVYTDVAADSVWSTTNAITGMGQNSTNGKVITGEPVYRSDLNGLDGYIYTDLDFSDTWVAVEGGTPVLQQFAEEESATKLTASGQRKSTGWYYNAAYRNASTTNSTTTYEIDNAAELYGLAELVNTETQSFSGMTVTMTKDIDINPGWTMGATTPTNKWTPIGHRVGGAETENIYFNGTFDGGNYSVKGIFVLLSDTANTSQSGNAQWSMGVGLFGAVQGNICNLKVENSRIVTNGTVVGAVTGELYGNMSNVYVADSVYVQGDRGETGGLVGRYHSKAVTASVSDCWFAGTARSYGGYVGGVVGAVIAANKTIQNCHNTGSVISTVSNSNSGTYVGGILGGASAATTVTNCVNEGSIQVAYKNSIGSVVGGGSGTVTLTNNYYTTAAVTVWGSASLTDTAITGSGAAADSTNTVSVISSYDSILASLNSDGVAGDNWVIESDKLVLSKFASTAQ